MDDYNEKVYQLLMDYRKKGMDYKVVIQSFEEVIKQKRVEFDKYFSSAEIDSTIDIDHVVFFILHELDTFNPETWSWAFVQTLNTNDCCDDTDQETRDNDYIRIDINDYENEFKVFFDEQAFEEIDYCEEEIRIYRCCNCKHIFITTDC